MAKTISNTDDIIDGRDIVARIDELEALESTLADAREEFAEAEPESDELTEAAKAVDDAESDFGEDEQKELKILREIVDESGSELRHGESLIRDSYFETYARELAEEVGDMPKNVKWPFTCIDWEKATDELKQDYTSVDFDGVDYWTRA